MAAAFPVTWQTQLAGVSSLKTPFPVVLDPVLFSWSVS